MTVSASIKETPNPETSSGSRWQLIYMDDKEYYSLMNRSSSWTLQQALKKKNSTNKALSQTQKTEFPDNAQTFTSLELRQGKADAEMLMEKQNVSE